MALSHPRIFLAPLAAAGLLAGCTPALDWREVRPAGSQLLLLFPCKPSAQERRVALAGQAVRMTLHACAAGGQTWGLAVADVADPTRVTPALAELGASSAANIGAAPARPAPFQVRDATPNAGSQRLRLQGNLPDGTQVKMQVAVFTHGTRVFQATVLGEALDTEAVDTFFDALRVQP